MSIPYHHQACALLAGLFLAGTALADSPASDSSVRKLLQLTSATDADGQIVSSLVNGLKARHPEIPAEFWFEFAGRIRPAELLERNVELYRNSYTEAEVQAAVAFYSSPEGRSFVGKQPQVMYRSIDVANEWAESVSRAALAEYGKRAPVAP